jgi:hypothetical protein
VKHISELESESESDVFIAHVSISLDVMTCVLLSFVDKLGTN